MKRILVFSDSHGETSDMIKITENLIGVDMIVHCGDYSKDAVVLRKAFRDIPVISVRGNNEFGFTTDEFTEIIEADGVRIFVTHGHNQGVKSGLDNLIERAKRENCTVCLFGHTHLSYCAEHDGIKLLNPGTAKGRFGSYGVVEIEDGRARTAVIDLN